MLKRATIITKIAKASKGSHIFIWNQNTDTSKIDRFLYDGKFLNNKDAEKIGDSLVYLGDISSRNKKKVVEGINIYQHKNKRVFNIPGKKLDGGIIGGRGTASSVTLSNIFKHDKDKVFDSLKTFADGKGGVGIKINKEQFSKAWDVATKQSIPRRLVKNIAKHPHRYGIGAVGIGAGAYAIHNMRSKKGGSELILPLSIKYASMAHDIIVARKDTNIHPSEAQIEAENYKKGTFKWNRLVIKLENPKGSTRSGTSPEGKKWSITMKNDYGYLSRTTSMADGDAVDIFMGKHPKSPVVYIVDQVNKDGSFDEHKCILGALTEDEARKTYLDNYEKGWTCGKITAMTIPHFKEWVMKGNTGKPVSAMKLFKVAQPRLFTRGDFDNYKIDNVPASMKRGPYIGTDSNGNKQYGFAVNNVVSRKVEKRSHSINMLTSIVASGRHTDNEGDANMRCPIMLKVAAANIKLHSFDDQIGNIGDVSRFKVKKMIRPKVNISKGLNLKKLTKPLGAAGNLAFKGLWVGSSLKQFGNAFKTVKGLKPPISRI